MSNHSIFSLSFSLSLYISFSRRWENKQEETGLIIITIILFYYFLIHETLFHKNANYKLKPKREKKITGNFELCVACVCMLCGCGCVCVACQWPTDWRWCQKKIILLLISFEKRFFTINFFFTYFSRNSAPCSEQCSTNITIEIFAFTLGVEFVLSLSLFLSAFLLLLLAAPFLLLAAIFFCLVFNIKQKHTN